MSLGPRRKPVVLGRTQQRRHRPDYGLVIISVILLVIGLILIYSISPGLSATRHVSNNYYTNKQMIAVLLGLFTFGVMAALPLDIWKHAQKPLIVVAGVATLIALVTPVSPDYPAHRWVRFGGISFQSVELVKFSVIFMLAAFLVDRFRQGLLVDYNKTLKPLLIALGVIGVVVAFIQSDLGSMGVIVAMAGAMAYVVGLPMKKILAVVAVLAVGVMLAISSTPYRRERLFTYMHPERDCLGAGYQECQALITIGSGGIAGKGFAQSVQAYGYLPESANDSIFAIFAEKFGFIGTTALVCVFMALFVRLKNIMERAPDLFSRLVVAGVLAWLSTQTLINIGAMAGLLPLKGITLPFISYGGTSIMFVTAAIGLVFNISRYTTYNVNDSDETEGSSRNDYSTDRRRDRRTYYTPVGRR